MLFMEATLGGKLASGLRVDFFALADFFGEATLVAAALAAGFFAVAFFATGFFVAVFFTGLFVAMIILLNFELRYLG
jgi:hypothetical protein